MAPWAFHLYTQRQSGSERFKSVTLQWAGSNEGGSPVWGTQKSLAWFAEKKRAAVLCMGQKTKVAQE